MKINLKNISQSFDGKELFAHLQYCFEPGNMYLLKGDSGSGKSTLLKILAQLIEPQSGQIDFEGYEDFSILELRRKVQYLPQLPVIFEGTIEDNLLKPFSFAPYHKSRPKKEVYSAQLSTLFPNGLSLDKDAQKLSQGEKQRVALARILLLKPEVLLCDEPAASLDPESRKLVDQSIGDYHRENPNSIVIYISHHDEVCCGGDHQILFLNASKLELRQ